MYRLLTPLNDNQKALMNAILKETLESFVEDGYEFYLHESPDQRIVGAIVVPKEHDVDLSPHALKEEAINETNSIDGAFYIYFAKHALSQNVCFIHKNKESMCFKLNENFDFEHPDIADEVQKSLLCIDLFFNYYDFGLETHYDITVNDIIETKDDYKRSVLIRIAKVNEHKKAKRKLEEETNKIQKVLNFKLNELDSLE